MTATVFVDTDVFLYALDDTNRAKQDAARNWRGVLWRERLGKVSYQVLSEFYVNALRMRPSLREEARAEVLDLLAWRPIPTDADLIGRGWKIQDRYHLSYWDCLIVAAAKVAACRYLLTEDLQPGQKLDGVEVVSPFLADPADLL